MLNAKRGSNYYNFKVLYDSTANTRIHDIKHEKVWNMFKNRLYALFWELFVDIYWFISYSRVTQVLLENSKTLPYDNYITYSVMHANYSCDA